MLDSLRRTAAIFIITARIRRMGEGTVFSLFVSPHLGGVGGTLVRSGRGVPHLRYGRGVPPGPGMGDPPGQTWDAQTWDQVPPPPRHSEHLRRGGRYASCVHAGGLSCHYY